jgi:hypothetical protein
VNLDASMYGMDMGVQVRARSEKTTLAETGLESSLQDRKTKRPFSGVEEDETGMSANEKWCGFLRLGGAHESYRKPLYMVTDMTGIPLRMSAHIPPRSHE